MEIVLALWATSAAMPLYEQATIRGQIALITGASSGIGEACALRLAEAGCKVVVVARREERLVALRDKIVAMFGTPVHVVVLDARDRDAVMFLPDKLPEEFRAVDIVINNAGLALGTHGVHECDAEDVVTMIETNVTGAILLSRAFLAGMRARNRGHLVCMSSIAGHETYAGGSVYCATKHALQAFTNAARHDLVDSDVRVTSICPGAVRTEFSVVRYKGDRASADNVYRGFEPLTAEDVANAVMYALLQPKHVQVADVVVLATRQSGAKNIARAQQ